MVSYTKGKDFSWPAFITPFLLPVSVIWEIIIYLKLNIRYFMYGGQGANSKVHKKKVAEIQDQVKRWRHEGKGRKMCSARPSWMSISQQKIGYKDRMYRIQLGQLQDILEIDTENLTVTVEPGVTIGHLNRVLVNNGVTLPVVPELDQLTIGGLLMGGGIESTSHKYGLLHDTCVEYHLVTADGEMTVATADNKNKDIFETLPMSYGTLGFVVLAKLKLVKYKPYIKLVYWTTNSLDETTSVFERETKKSVNNDSVEGIAYSRDKAVIMTGTFIEESEVEWDKVNRMGLWYKQWFYLYVQTFIDRRDKGPWVEYVPTLHFHQRHNKPTFWLSKNWLPWAMGPIARFLTGWALPMNTQLLQLLRDTFIGGEMTDNTVLQDFILPLKELKDGVDLSHRTTGIYPLWLVPAALDMRLFGGQKDEIFVDLGVYGSSEIPEFAGSEATLRKFELFTIERKGFQALYAETLMNYDEFLTMFSGGAEPYKKVRDRLPFCKEGFPETFMKVSKEGRAAAKALKRNTEEEDFKNK